MQSNLSSPYQSAPVQPVSKPSSPGSPSDPITEIEFDNVVGFKLSDAIREGSKNLRQEYGWGDGIESGCALTAARVAIESKGYGINK